MRGWSHGVATLAALVVTLLLLGRTTHDRVRFTGLLVFGLSMMLLYGVSAAFHLGPWRGRTARVLCAVDHANIFVLIAGTYTPIALIVFSGWLRLTVLITIWTLALAGMASAVFTLRLPRWFSTALYVVMGWLALATLPWMARLLPWPAIACMVLGGVLYTVGAVVFALKRPDPLPRIFGFHEIFHLFTIGGGAAFVVMIWVWIVPFVAG